ncbi:unnamed protein product [Arabidopsis arenosa]|uniref:Uncharacterized protein n=1 Tax=Arabidopsis arenosa TaxID=38785 RepID=A0A8S1ZPE0_ARAAE|nr:unnamed protein product [Arabidopsis arenosa]
MGLSMCSKVSLIETLHDYYYTIGRLGVMIVRKMFTYRTWVCARRISSEVRLRKRFTMMLRNELRILCPDKDDIKKGWSGLQSFPRKIWLDESGKQLLQYWPIEEIETLRGTQVNCHEKVLKAGSTHLDRRRNGGCRLRRGWRMRLPSD